MNLENDLEDEAEKCLQHLINRCLVLVSKKSVDETKIRSCKVHDLIYHMFLREIQRGNVFIVNDIVFEISDTVNRQFLSSRKMQPFKPWTGDEIYDFPYGLYRVLLTPSHYQLTDDNDKNHLLKRTHSVFFSGHFVSVFILKSEVIHFKFLKILDLSKCKSFTRNTQGVEVDPTWTS